MKKQASSIEPARQRGLSKKESLADSIYANLRSAIIRGELAPKTRLAQIDIANQMGSSQAPVREALQRLELDGLVERYPHGGHYVSDISIDEMYQIFSIRCNIECFAVQRVARIITSSQCEELIGRVEQMTQAAHDDDLVLLVEHDMQFHKMICEWSGCKALVRAWTPLYSQVQRFDVQSHPRYFDDLFANAMSHMQIVDVLRNGHPEEAVATIKTHIMAIWSKIELNGDFTLLR
ncbi:MAG: GntR family transcriptional regulator [Caldilineaceae bacterium]